MFGSALIVFRESLEAALLIGIIAAATRDLRFRNRWIMLGIVAGVLGSLAVAGLTESIAGMADGSGQELFNAGVLGIAVLMIGWHNIWMASHGKEMAAKAKLVGGAVRSGTQELSAIAIAIALTVLREGAETALFMHGLIASAPDSAATVLLGGLLGLVTGAALGVIMYLGLLRIPVRRFFAVTNGLLLLLAAGLASQMARFLIQADKLPSLAAPLWDSSALLPLTSWLGTTLHILIGYEARPAGMQVVFYVATLVLIGLGARWVQRRSVAPSYKLESA